MTDIRRIIRVCFVKPTQIGSIRAGDDWAAAAPASSGLANAVTARFGDPSRGEPRDSLVFECRTPGDPHDAIVPFANIAAIIVEPHAPDPKPATAQPQQRKAS